MRASATLDNGFRVEFNPGEGTVNIAVRDSDGNLLGRSDETVADFSRATTVVISQAMQRAPKAEKI